MFHLGPSEVIVLSALGLLLFGPRLPELSRALGRGIAEFRRGLGGLADDFRD